jgi:CHAP domain
MKVSEKAARVALTQLGVHEIGTSNWGGKVSEYLKSTGIDFGAAWCAAFVHWCYEAAGYELGGGASVGNFLGWAEQRGYARSKPTKGAIACFNFGEGHGFGDHTGIVLNVLPGGFIRTIEGNTSAASGGSQSNGGCVAIKTRKASLARYVVIPGDVPAGEKKLARRPIPKPKPKLAHAVKHPVAYVLKRRLRNGLVYAEPAGTPGGVLVS